MKNWKHFVVRWAMTYRGSLVGVCAWWWGTGVRESGVVALAGGALRDGLVCDGKVQEAGVAAVCAGEGSVAATRGFRMG